MDSSLRTVKLDIASRYEMVEMAQTVLAHLATLVGFDEDASHYMNVALREAVINAIKHGNERDEDKRVEIEFVLHEAAMEIVVRDEGDGFDPAAVPDPLAQENLLKPHGRGIFFMRSFMEKVDYSFLAAGGTQVRMFKARPA